VTFTFPEFIGPEVRKLISGRAKSIGICTFRVKMNLESIVLYFNKKDLAAVEIHTEINHILGEGTIGCSTVTRYLCKQSFADSSILPAGDREIQGPDAIGIAILQALAEQPFASLH
jgi:hypothetical protein